VTTRALVENETQYADRDGRQEKVVSDWELEWLRGDNMDEAIGGR